MAVQSGLGFAGIRVPQADRAVLTAAGEGVAIRRKHHRMDPMSMPAKDRLVLAVAHVPQPDRISTSTGEGFAVWRKRHRTDRPGMSFENRLEVAAGRIPQPDRLVRTPAGQHVPIRRKRHGRYGSCMPGQQRGFGAGKRIVKPDADTAGRCELRASGRIRALGYTPFTEAYLGSSGQPPAGIVLVHAVGYNRRHIPQHNRTILTSIGQRLTIWGKCEGSNVPPKVSERSLMPGEGHSPQPDRLVRTPAG